MACVKGSGNDETRNKKTSHVFLNQFSCHFENVNDKPVKKKKSKGAI